VARGGRLPGRHRSHPHAAFIVRRRRGSSRSSRSQRGGAQCQQPGSRARLTGGPTQSRVERFRALVRPAATCGAGSAAGNAGRSAHGRQRDARAGLIRGRAPAARRCPGWAADCLSACQWATTPHTQNKGRVGPCLAPSSSLRRRPSSCAAELTYGVDEVSRARAAPPGRRWPPQLGAGSSGDPVSAATSETAVRRTRVATGLALPGRSLRSLHRRSRQGSASVGRPEPAARRGILLRDTPPGAAATIARRPVTPARESAR
jgi:hypothetical protein